MNVIVIHLTTEVVCSVEEDPEKENIVKAMNHFLNELKKTFRFNIQLVSGRNHSKGDPQFQEFQGTFDVEFRIWKENRTAHGSHSFSLLMMGLAGMLGYTFHVEHMWFQEDETQPTDKNENH